METPVTLIEGLFERAEGYGKASYELTRLKSLETTTVVATALISWLGVIITVAFFILILTLGIALWLGDLLGKPYYGFFIVAAFYLVTASVLYFFLPRWIKKPVSDLIITQALQ